LTGGIARNGSAAQNLEPHDLAGRNALQHPLNPLALAARAHVIDQQIANCAREAAAVFSAIEGEPWNLAHHVERCLRIVLSEIRRLVGDPISGGCRR